MRTAGCLAAGAALLLLVGCGGKEDTVPTPDSTPGAAQSARPTLPPPQTDPTTDPDQAAVAAALVGLPEKEAEQVAADAGYSTRIASVDGEPRVLTMDYRADRINLEITDGVVSRAYVG